MDKFQPDFWKEVQRLVGNVRDRLARERMDFMRMSETELKVNMAKDEVLSYISDMPDNFEKALETLNHRYAEMRGRIDEHKKQTGSE